MIMLARISALFQLELLGGREETVAAKNLNIVLAIILVGTSFGVVVRLVWGVGLSELVYAFAGLFAIALIFLWLSKNGYTAVPSYLLPFFFLAAVTYLRRDGGLSDIGLSGFVIAILLAGLLSGKNGVLIYTFLTIGVILAMGVAEFNAFTDRIILVALSFGFIGFILYLILNTLTNVAAKEQQSNQELKALSQALEKKVEERVRDLTLATQAGSKIAGLNDLAALFQQSIDLICHLFHLSYGQVYLINQEDQHLVLQAGTGFVGVELLRRGHFLLVNSGSINGRAVVERQPVIVSDVRRSPDFKPNPLLPNTRSEMAIPLTIGEQVLGVLNLQDDKPDTFSQENVSVFQTVANQLAVAIQNANLIHELEAAQQDVETLAQRITQRNWATFLDGIANPAQLQIQWQDEAQPFHEQVSSTAEKNLLQVPLTIAHEPLGRILIERSPDQPFDAELVELATAVSQQISQQLENLRLLSEAERYRSDAENAAKRLTREAWWQYRAGAEANGFVYDQMHVKPFASGEVADSDSLFNAPLEIQGEVIGEIMVSGLGDDPDNYALVGIVADQLSTHIENLRLSQQTEMALAQTDSLYRIGRDFNAATNVKEILLASLQPIQHTGVTEATLMFVELDSVGQPATLELLASWRFEGDPSFPVGTRFDVAQFPFAGLFLQDPKAAQVIGNVPGDSRVDSFTGQAMAHAGIQAIAVVPLTMAQQWVGIITFSWPFSRTFSRRETEIFNALINLAAPAVQSQRLYLKTKAQADKERLINLITQRIQGATTMESALQTAVAELGQTFKAGHTEVSLNLSRSGQLDTELATNGHS
jgi:GAF domain-containing protein